MVFDRRLAGEDDEFFSPTDASFLNEVVGGTSAAGANIAATAPTPPAPTARAGSYVIDPLQFGFRDIGEGERYQTGLGNVQDYFNLTPLGDLSRFAQTQAQGEGEYTTRYKLPEFQSYLSEQGMELREQALPGNRVARWVQGPQGVVEGTYQEVDLSDKDFGIATALLGAAAGNIAPLGFGALNVGMALDQGDPLRALAALGGVSGGLPIPAELASTLQTAGKVAGVAQAAQSGDWVSALTGGMNLAGVGDIAGFSTKDIQAAGNVASAIQTGDASKLISAANHFVNSPELGLAGKAAAVIEAVNSGNPGRIANATMALGKDLSAMSTSKTDTGDETARLAARYGTASDALIKQIEGMSPTVPSSTASTADVQDAIIEDVLRQSPGQVTSTASTKDVEDALLDDVAKQSPATVPGASATTQDVIDVIRSGQSKYNVHQTFGEAFNAARKELGAGKSFKWTNPQTGVTQTYTTDVAAAKPVEAGAGRGLLPGMTAADAAKAPALSNLKPLEPGVPKADVAGAASSDVSDYSDIAQAMQGTIPSADATYATLSQNAQSLAKAVKGTVFQTPTALALDAASQLGTAFAATGGVGKDNTTLQEFKKIRDIAEDISPPEVISQIKQLNQNIQSADGVWSTLSAIGKGVYQQPLGLLWMGASEVVQDLPLLGAGKVISVGAKALDLVPKVQAALGVSSSVALSMLENGGAARDETYERVQDLLKDQVKTGKITQTEADALSQKQADNAFVKSMGITGAISLIPGATSLEKQIIVKGAVNDAQSVIGTALKVGAKELTPEAAEGAGTEWVTAGETYGAVGKGYADVPLKQIVGAGALEALIGGPTAGTIAGGHAALSKLGAFDAAADDAAPPASAPPATTPPGEVKPSTTALANTVVATDEDGNPVTLADLNLGDITAKDISSDSTADDLAGLSAIYTGDTSQVASDLAGMSAIDKAPSDTDITGGVAPDTVIATDNEGNALTAADLGLGAAADTTPAITQDTVVATDIDGNVLTAADAGIQTKPTIAPAVSPETVVATDSDGNVLRAADVGASATPTIKPETKVDAATKTEIKPDTVVAVDADGNSLTASDVTAAVKPDTNAEPDTKPNTKPDTKPEVKPDVKPDVKPGVEPDIKPDTKPEPDVKPDVKPETKTEVKPEVKPEPKLDVKTETKSETEPETKLDTKPGTEPEAKPDAKPDVKPDVKPGVEPDAKPDTKPEVKPETKPEVKTEVKVEPETKTEVKPEVKPDTKVEPEVKTEVKPEVKVEPETKTEVKPEVKPETKVEPEVKTEAKTEVKPEGKPETKPETKPEVKPETKVEPEVKPETKTETKPEPKVEPEAKTEVKPEVKTPTNVRVYEPPEEPLEPKPPVPPPEPPPKPPVPPPEPPPPKPPVPPPEPPPPKPPEPPPPKPPEPPPEPPPPAPPPPPPKEPPPPKPKPPPKKPTAANPLALLLAASKKKPEEPYQVARIPVESPFGTVFDALNRLYQEQDITEDDLLRILRGSYE